VTTTTILTAPNELLFSLYNHQSVIVVCVLSQSIYSFSCLLVGRRHVWVYSKRAQYNGSSRKTFVRIAKLVNQTTVGWCVPSEENDKICHGCSFWVVHINYSYTHIHLVDNYCLCINHLKSSTNRKIFFSLFLWFKPIDCKGKNLISEDFLKTF
jgi:hypothetical protein